MPVIWGLADPKIGEREVTRALLEHDHHVILKGQVILGDKGFAGREFEAFITEDLGATLVRPDRKDENPASAGSAASGNGSNPSLTPSKASSASKGLLSPRCSAPSPRGRSTASSPRRLARGPCHLPGRSG